MSKFVKIEGNKVVGIVSCAQDPTHWPDILEVEDNDPRYLEFEANLLSGNRQTEAIARAWRDAEIERVTWLRDRHRDELELSAQTTISAAQYAELLVYIQALRDWPTITGFPSEPTKPVVPAWVATQR